MTYFYDINQVFPTEVYQSGENPPIFYPVINQVYVPENQFYKIVHAVEYLGTTYFYENIVDFPIYHVYNTISYTPAHNVGGNTSYWPVENNYTDISEGHIENNSYIQFEPSFVESLPLENNVILPYEDNVTLPAENIVTLPAENNMSLLPSMNTSTFFSPELDAETSVPNNFWSSAVDQSQYDIVENYHRSVNQSSEIYRSSYSEQIVTWNAGTVCYQEVNYGLYQFSCHTSLEDGSANETMEAPVLSLETLEKDAAKAYVKYRKDCIYLTALSGKLYKKEAIPVVKRLSVITEDDNEYPEVDSSSNDVEYNTQNKSVVEANTLLKYSKELCRREKVKVVEKSGETPTLKDMASAWGIENISEIPTHEEMALALGIETISETKQQVDLAPRENKIAHQRKKVHRKKCCIAAENTHLIEDNYSKDQLAESSQNFAPEVKKNLLTFEEKAFRKRTEKTSRKVKLEKRDGKMKSVEKTDKQIVISETNETEDQDGFIGSKGDTKKNFAHENGFLSKSIEIPQAENTNTVSLLHPKEVDITPVFNKGQTSLDICDEIKNHNIVEVTDVNVPDESHQENTSFSPVSEEVDLKDSQECEKTLGNDNEPTKVHSKKPKKKRFRRFLERLLCCCTKGPA